MALPQLNFYCDETSHIGHRYAAVGGTLVRADRVAILNEQIAQLKSARGKATTSEIKWGKINRHDRPLYLDAVQLFFSLLKGNLIHYHVVICDFHEYDHRRFTQGNKHVSVSKTYYQLLLHRCCKLYAGKAHIHVWPDRGECTQALPTFIGALRADERKRFGAINPTISSINPICSSTVGVMHLNDIITGAIASHRNGRHLQPDASPHKTKIAEAVLDGFGLATFAFSTPIRNNNTVWNWKPPQGRLQS